VEERAGGDHIITLGLCHIVEWKHGTSGLGPSAFREIVHGRYRYIKIKYFSSRPFFLSQFSNIGLLCNLLLF